MVAVRREGQTRLLETQTHPNQAGIIISIITSEKTPSKHYSKEQVLMSTGHLTTPYLRRVRSRGVDPRQSQDRR